MLWNLHQAREFVFELARNEANLSFEKDQAYRLWSAKHGGVYVPATPESPPNPYLSHVPERDIQTPAGRALTLVNPAYMTRQVHELTAQLYGTRGHLTSLKPLRPENAPDVWETKALKDFEHGRAELVEQVDLAGQPYLRLMRPWRTEQICLKCHAGQGYRVGDIRGGISIAVPLQPYLAGIRTQTRNLLAGHGLIWLLGAAGIVMGGRRIRKHLQERRQTEAELAETLKQKEEALAQSARLASFPQLNPNPVLEIDASGDITFANQAALEVVRQLAPGSGLLDFLPQDWQEIKSTIRKKDDSNTAYDVQIKDRVFSASIAFVKKFEVWRIYARDITKRVHAEAALRESEASFRSLFENMAEGVVIHEMLYGEDGRAVDYRILAANPAFEKHTGLKVADLEGLSASQAYGTGEAPYLEVYSRVAQTGDPTTFETFFPTLQRYFHISATSLKPGHFVTVFEDITERRNFEEALHRSNQRLDLLAESAGQLLASVAPLEVVNVICPKVMKFLDCQVFFNFLLDENQKRLHLNAYAGIPEEEAHRIEWLDYGVAVCGCAAQDGCRIVSEDIQTTLDTRTDLVKSYGVQAYACHPLVMQDRVLGTLSFGTRNRTRFTDEELGLMKAVADQVAIAMERQRSEEALREHSSELSRVVADLEQKNAEIERFTYMISHDLKSPLVTISTFLGYLEKDIASGDTDRVAKDMQHMYTAADKMGRMLKELLEMSRIGRMINPPGKVTFRELVEEALNAVAGPLSGRGLDVEVRQAEITFFGDRPRLVEIWQNLLENAIKFMGDQRAPALTIGAEQQGLDTVFFVCDNGIGIDPRYQEKVFGIFEKLDSTVEGTGIGLALAKRIVELYQGKIWVESAGLGQGACFQFTLPGALKGEGVERD